MTKAITKLIKSKDFWLLSFKGRELKFPTIEDASSYMMTELLIKDEDIDDAIIEMAGFDNNVAFFNDQGRFLNTGNS